MDTGGTSSVAMKALGDAYVKQWTSIGGNDDDGNLATPWYTNNSRAWNPRRNV